MPYEIIAVGKGVNCGCLTLLQQTFDVEGGAIITETSSSNPLSSSFEPLVTEDELYYLVPENYTDMSDPIKITELTAASANDVAANLSTSQVVLSLNTGSGYTSLKLSFTDLITVIKANIYGNKFTVTMSGNSGQSDDLIGVVITDAELNGVNISILSAVPLSGEQGVYVDTVTGDYEVYNISDDLTGSILKLIYQNA